MKFNYTAVDSDGVQIRGEKEATDNFLLSRELKKDGLTLLTATPIKVKINQSFFSKFTFGGVSFHEKIIFARNLGSMLQAGLPVSRALTVLEKQSRSVVLKKVINSINESVKKGSGLSDSMRQFPKIFPPLFSSMVAVGEETGRLSNSLDVIANQMEKSYLLQKKIKGAMIYPSVIIAAMIIIGFFMLVYIVPTLTNTFKELNVELPATTRALIATSDFISANLSFSIILGFAIVIILVILSRTKKGKRFFDFVFLHLPIISSLVKETNSARTARTMSSLLTAGVPVIQSIEITRDVIQNSYYKEVLDRAKISIQKGVSMSGVFNESISLYPPFVGEMIAVGEETSDLGQTLLRVADFYEAEVEQKTKDMSTVIEPFLMIIVGLAVGFFALSMISPIYSIVDKI